jgi:hypothetical protein
MHVRSGLVQRHRIWATLSLVRCGSAAFVLGTNTTRTPRPVAPRAGPLRSRRRLPRLAVSRRRLVLRCACVLVLRRGRGAAGRCGRGRPHSSQTPHVAAIALRPEPVVAVLARARPVLVIGIASRERGVSLRHTELGVGRRVERALVRRERRGVVRAREEDAPERSTARLEAAGSDWAVVFASLVLVAASLPPVSKLPRTARMARFRARQRW